VGVTRSRGTARFSPSFLLSQGSHPASGDLRPDVPVEAFLSRGHVDVEGFLAWQFYMAFCLVHHCGLFSSDGVVILPGMFCYY